MSHKDTLLKPFWDTVLPDVPSPTYDSERERARDEFWTDDDEERDRKREIIRGMWTRVNGALMHKRTHEVRFGIAALTADDPIHPVLAQHRAPSYRPNFVARNPRHAHSDRVCRRSRSERGRRMAGG